MKEIKLIIGLANPGSKYEKTRHNAGAWFVQQLAHKYNATFQENSKLLGSTTIINIGESQVKLFIPQTFMNNSGTAVNKIMEYYKLNQEYILIAHDDLEINVGKAKYKAEGGHGGHNGLRDIIGHLDGNNKFHRLRIGIGRPPSKEDVTNYVLAQPSAKEYDMIQATIVEAIAATETGYNKNIKLAVNQLHAFDALSEIK